MTQTPPQTRTIELPEIIPPVVTRIVSNPIFPPEKGGRAGQHADEPITWMLGEAHPMVPSTRIARIVIHTGEGRVEIYSVSADGRATVRNILPFASVRLTEESMPVDVFVEELARSEDKARYDDEYDDDSEDDEGVVNGDASTPVPIVPSRPALVPVPSTAAPAQSAAPTPMQNGESTSSSTEDASPPPDDQPPAAS